MNVQPVLILGAGINGAAIARELLLNGVPVWLVDQADIASGATAYSSRLIHGGLRYLEHREFDLVRESLHERTRLLRLAPQFVQPLRLFIPTETRWGGIGRTVRQFLGWTSRPSATFVPRGAALVDWGLWLYDKFANDPNLPRRAKHLLTDDNVPRVNRSRFRWLASYHDAQIRYPERFVLALLRDAERISQDKNLEFRILTYHQVRLEAEQARIWSTTPDSAYTVTPAALVNATGAWVDRTLQQLPLPTERLMGGTRGSHLICRNAELRRQLQFGGIYAEASDGRPLFVLPFGELILLGTTDLPFRGNPRDAVATNDEVDYLLASVNTVLQNTCLTRSDIIAHYCGVRPLPFVDHKSPASITRRHRLEVHPFSNPPVYSVIGGKLTTCRSLAATVAETLLDRLGYSQRHTSEDLVVAGGESYPTSPNDLTACLARIAAEYELKTEQVGYLWAWYGTRTQKVLAECMGNKSYGRGLVQIGQSGVSLPIPVVRWIIRHEWVQTLSDLVERRLMLAFEPDLDTSTLHQLAELLQQEQVISKDGIRQSVQQCVDRLHIQYGRKIR